MKPMHLMRSVAGAAAIAITGLLGAAPALAAGGTPDAIWQTALSGHADETFALIGEMAERDDREALRTALERRSEHLKTIEQRRAERLEEVRDELDDAIEEDDLSGALRSAVEMHTLSTDKDGVLEDPKVEALVSKAVEDATSAEREHRWLDVYELYYRLNLLFEQEGTYRDDFDRISRRLVMLRLYVPEKLHDMRSAQRVDDGEDPLPAYNGLADDWQDKLEGVSQSMVIRALNRAERSHVEGADLREMLLAGLQSVVTMSTTPDLASEFRGLERPEDVRAFAELIEERRRSLINHRGSVGYFELVGTLKDLLRANDRTIRVAEPALLHEFGNGAMSVLDEFSNIIWPDEIRQFQKSTQGSFTGVGIQITLDESQAVKVVTPLQGTPAQKAGVLPGDVIVGVDGESTVGISLQQAVDRISGEKGTPVTLSIEREGEPDPVELTMTRDEIPIYSVKGWERNGPRETDWDWFIDEEAGIGIVRVTQFAETTTRELRTAIREMEREGLRGLILDLRFNPGGLLTEAVSVANLFVEEGVIVSQHDAEGVLRDSQRARPGRAELSDLPVVVLINEGSASASEIVAGCLQDYEKALVVGARTFGKGSVQNVYAIGNRGEAALKLTTQYYYLPSGRLIHRRPGAERWGVAPDIEVEMLPQQIADSLRLRQDADLFLDGQDDDEEAADPDKLLDDGVDTQLETALLLLRSQVTSDGRTRVTMRGEAPAKGS